MLQDAPHRSGPAFPARLAAALAALLSLSTGLGLALLDAGATTADLPLGWLGGAAMAAPAIALAVVLTLRAAVAHLGEPAGWRPPERLFVAAVTSVAGASAVAATTPFTALLLGGDRGGATAAHMLLDGIASVSLALPVAGAVLLAHAADPRGIRLGGPRQVLLAAGSLGLALLVSVGGQTGASAAGVPSPCPASTPLANQKSFDVQTLAIDMPLNRFGDHDPQGVMYALTSQLPAINAELAKPFDKRVSVGEHGDAIQPLVIRANMGDCVRITYRNTLPSAAGLHIDGLSYIPSDSAGDNIGLNGATSVRTGDSRTYTYYIPKDARLEGAHYISPGAGNRELIDHGLFGSLVVEPAGSTYIDPNTGGSLESGWEAIISPGGSKKDFREYVPILHEIGNESYDVMKRDGSVFPKISKFTDVYRPGSRAINYRSEPFDNRVSTAHGTESLGYGSYTFGDPATPIQRAYLGDPTKWRLVHGGAEMFHIFHLHGGGDRWRFNPAADHTYDYQDTGLNKTPSVQQSPSMRLDSQSVGPGESYNLEIEGGAGGVQQAAGDFLWHCHIGKHYVGGMWTFWRVYDTRKPDLVPLPDRANVLRDAVPSTGLIGRTMPNGTVITAENLDDWIRPQLPPQGTRVDDQDATVWDWTTVPTADGPLYLGEPDATDDWVDYQEGVPGHRNSLPGDRYLDAGPDANRPIIMFNPVNGRPTFPLLRPHHGERPPFSPNGHSGAPWLGENADVPDPHEPTLTNPWTGRKDGLCPRGAPMRKFNIVAIETPVQITDQGATDPNGQLFVLAHDKEGVYAGTKERQPLAIRANIGDCVGGTLTNEQTDAGQWSGFAKVNMHIHHVQFDPQASDGVISGMSFEQSVRPYKVEDAQLTAPVAASDTALALSRVPAKLRPGVWIAVGQGTESIEVRQIETVAAGGVTLTEPLARDHDAGQWAGTEFVQFRWYPDVALDNIFWHDHVDGIHNWGRGLVGQLVIEPKGSTYHDPRTGEEVDSGTIVDVHTDQPLIKGQVDGSFRESVLWQIDENPITDGTFNLRAEPWADRLLANGDPSLLFSSYTHGDPYTPMPRAYANDPLVVRGIQVSDSQDGIHFDGPRTFMEPRYLDSNGRFEASPTNTVHWGVSERFTFVMEGGAGGLLHQPGDYMYWNSAARHFRQGAWGLIRVLDGQVPGLKPLPGVPVPRGDGSLPAPTGGRPPATAGPGNPCPVGAPAHRFEVSAVDVHSSLTFNGWAGQAFVPTAQAAAVEARTLRPEPLVLHVAAGECIDLVFQNRRSVRASFHADGLIRANASSGVNAGYGSEQTVAPGATRTYRFYADTWKIGMAPIADFGGAPAVVNAAGGVNTGVDTGTEGMYGAFVVAPAGATFSNPHTGFPTDVGTKVDVHVPGRGNDYRDFSLFMSEEDPVVSENKMPYPIFVNGRTLVNYQGAPRQDDTGAAFAGTPATPLLEAYAGDPMTVHAMMTPGSEQNHVFTLGGLSFPTDPALAAEGDAVESLGVAPWETVDAQIIGGAGGRGHMVGDFFYGDQRRPFQQAGLWGLQRVYDPANADCPVRPLEGRPCGAAADAPAVEIDEAPDVVSGVTTPSFRFSSDDSSATYECSLSQGGDAYEPCESPMDYPAQPDGEYTFRVRASNGAGSSVASASFTIDTAAPTVSLTRTPPNVTRDRVATFAFTSEPGATFECSLERAGRPDAFGGCTSPIAFESLADGTYAFAVRAVDAAGNAGEARYGFTVETGTDTTAPGITRAPAAELVTGRSAVQGTVPVRVSWAAEDASGVARYELQMSGDGGSTWTSIALPGATTTAVQRNLVQNRTYRFRVRATDAATPANATDWVAGPTFKLGVVNENAGASVVRLAGAWRAQRLAGAFGGAVRYATAAGSSARLVKFTGTSASFVTATGPNRGRVDVYLDGVKQNASPIDLYAAAQELRRTAWAASGLAAGEHTLEIRALGTKRPASRGTRVYLDAFVTIGR
jgi:hypothetical protein